MLEEENVECREKEVSKEELALLRFLFLKLDNFFVIYSAALYVIGFPRAGDLFCLLRFRRSSPVS